MRIILDTGVFYRPGALRDAMERREALVVPAIAYAERLRQLAAQSAKAAAGFAEAFRPFVEPFGATHADRVMPRLAEMDRPRWRRLARDAFIACHVRPGDELWTIDAADFMAVGVAKQQIHEC